MTSKLIRAASPPPFLKTERSADYERLLGRLEAELKPTDIMEEFYVYDIAYWTWDLWRWRRIKTCLIDHKFFNAFQWTSILLPTQRLAHIGKTDQLDAKNVAKKTEEYQEKIAALGPEFDEVFGKEEHTDELSETLADIASMRDIAVTRVFLEEFDNVERIDKMIVAAERRRDAAFRELERHRANVASRWREKIRNIEEAEFKVIKPEKPRANGRKSAA